LSGGVGFYPSGTKWREKQKQARTPTKKKEVPFDGLLEKRGLARDHDETQQCLKEEARIASGTHIFPEPTKEKTSTKKKKKKLKRRREQGANQNYRYDGQWERSIVNY